jgi:peptidoglycan/LPS O-acetylase OafA/YrhL
MNMARRQAGYGGRFALLDELRGIAALAVCLFHIGTRATGVQLFPNGYLAVDFFFMLSGFVLAEAYQRLGRTGAGGGMDWAGFARRRLVRMAPVAVLGRHWVGSISSPGAWWRRTGQTHSTRSCWAMRSTC